MHIKRPAIFWKQINWKGVCWVGLINGAIILACVGFTDEIFIPIPVMEDLMLYVNNVFTTSRNSRAMLNAALRKLSIYSESYSQSHTRLNFIRIFSIAKRNRNTQMAFPVYVINLPESTPGCSPPFRIGKGQLNKVQCDKEHDAIRVNDKQGPVLFGHWRFVDYAYEPRQDWWQGPVTHTAHFIYASSTRVE